MDLLTFATAGRVLGVPLASVDGLEPLGTVVQLPAAPPHVRGITTRHGRLLPVLDLPRLLGEPDGPRAAERWLVIVRAGALVAGFAVDERPSIGDEAETVEVLAVGELLERAAVRQSI